MAIIYHCINCQKQINGLYVHLPNMKTFGIICMRCIRDNSRRVINMTHKYLKKNCIVCNVVFDSYVGIQTRCYKCQKQYTKDYNLNYRKGYALKLKDEEIGKKFKQLINDMVDYNHNKYDCAELVKEAFPEYFKESD